MQTKNKIFYSALSGILLSVAFPPFPIFITAFFAFIPLFIVLNDEEQMPQAPRNKRFPYIYITFFIYHLCSNWWISTLQENSDPYLFWSGIALDIFHPIFFFFPFLLFFISNRLVGNSLSMWLFPMFWTIFEWLHSIGDMGYSWLSIAHTQYTNLYWYQIIDIAGIWGATFLLVTANVLIYKLMLSGKNENGKYSFKTFFNSSLKKIYAITIYAIVVIPMIYGFVAISNFDYEKQLMNNEFLNIGLIQPNINPWDKWETARFKQIQTHLRLQDSLINAIKKSNAAGKLNLCIWSETAIPVLDLSVNRDMKLDFITQDLLRTNTSLLTGIAKYHFYNENEELPITVNYFRDDTNIPYSSFNAALMLNPVQDNSLENLTSESFTSNNSTSNNPTSEHSTSRNSTSNSLSSKNVSMQFHYKAKLTPFAEGFPYVEYLSFAKDWIRWGVGISAWEKGKKTECLVVENDGKTGKIAPIICIESVYPDHVRKFVVNGANIISVITNDAWYDYSSGPEQHYIIAATRAIENRRYVARCANSGVTGFIAPTGKTIERASQYEEAAIAASIPILTSDNLTIYTQYGDYLPVFFCLLSILIVLIQFVRKLKENPV